MSTSSIPNDIAIAVPCAIPIVRMSSSVPLLLAAIQENKTMMLTRIATFTCQSI